MGPGPAGHVTWDQAAAKLLVKFNQNFGKIEPKFWLNLSRAWPTSVQFR